VKIRLDFYTNMFVPLSYPRRLNTEWGDLIVEFVCSSGTVQFGISDNISLGLRGVIENIVEAHE
jgi:hypothetical protein